LIRLDADRFRRVLENLIGNARDALVSHAGERIVFVFSEIVDGAFRLRVADSGPGIPPELVDSLFEPFATGKTRGTGLGLVTVRNLIKAHGGRVDVEPQAPEGGAAFVISIPVDSEAEVVEVGGAAWSSSADVVS
jgi:two-component system sensor kinase FixL